MYPMSDVSSTIPQMGSQTESKGKVTWTAVLTSLRFLTNHVTLLPTMPGVMDYTLRLWAMVVWSFLGWLMSGILTEQ